MKRTGRVRSLVLILTLLLPMIVLSIQNITSQPSVWIVYTNAYDDNILLAGESFAKEMLLEGYIVQETTFENLNNIPRYSNAIVLVGHGQKEGLHLANSMLPWNDVNSALIKRDSGITILLACNSPSNPELSLYGFSSSIDAEAGALLAAWHVKRSINPNIENIPSSKIIDFQKAMKHPLGSYVYFVHGYHGTNDQFEHMTETLDLMNAFDGYDNYFFHSYFDDYSSVGNAHSASIEEFAVNFRNHLLNTHPAGTQIDIVAHSLGGIIARQMIMADRDTLESYGVEIGRVITLGTPHQGTAIADEGLGAYFTYLFDVFWNDVNWMSEVYLQVGIASQFMATLNADPMSYSAGIEWFTVSGISNEVVAGLLVPLHGGANDIPVASSRAHLSFATQVVIEDITHVALIDDPTYMRSYGYIDTWLGGGIDSDSDGIIDAEEKYVYNTDPNDSDTDNDELSDYAEIFVHSTLPLDWDTDGDELSDGSEISWGYDPTIATDPIDAPALIFSAWHVDGATGYVRANHYTAIDEVKVYVKYKNVNGYWTGYFYVGTDSTPYYSGDYYVSWSILQGYVQMCVKVLAYDVADHCLGVDYQYVTLPSSGGGKPGGDPVPI